MRLIRFVIWAMALACAFAAIPFVAVWAGLKRLLRAVAR